jgi:hypothetical protein
MSMFGESTWIVVFVILALGIAFMSGGQLDRHEKTARCGSGSKRCCKCWSTGGMKYWAPFIKAFCCAL